MRYRLHGNLAGRPDLLFPQQRVVVFCDGDFWHGRNLEARLARLASGHNAPYWVAKIQSNVDRDSAVSARLVAEGWHVIRVWETDVLRDPERVADMIATVVIQLRSSRR
jgi:DNA mismatch endonuclease, patch repair protein